MPHPDPLVTLPVAAEGLDERAGPAGRLCGSAIASGTLADCARALVDAVGSLGGHHGEGFRSREWERRYYRDEVLALERCQAAPPPP